MPRTPPAVKVHLSVDYHPRTSEVWRDPSRRGQLVEVWRLAYARFAAKRGDKLPLRPEDRLQITGMSDQDAADRTLRTLFKDLGYTCRSFKNRWEVTVCNFAKSQGVDPKESDPSSAANLSDRDMHRDKDKRNAEGRERDARERGNRPPDGFAVAPAPAPFRAVPPRAPERSDSRSARRAQSAQELAEAERVVKPEREENERRRAAERGV